MYSSTLPSTSALDGWWVINATTWPLYPRKRPVTHCIGGWVGPRAGLDWCGKSHPHRDSIPGPFSLQRIAIPTELSRPLRALGRSEISRNTNKCAILQFVRTNSGKPLYVSTFLCRDFQGAETKYFFNVYIAISLHMLWYQGYRILQVLVSLI